MTAWSLGTNIWVYKFGYRHSPFRLTSHDLRYDHIRFTKFLAPNNMFLPVPGWWPLHFLLLTLTHTYGDGEGVWSYPDGFTNEDLLRWDSPGLLGFRFGGLCQWLEALRLKNWELSQVLHLWKRFSLKLCWSKSLRKLVYNRTSFSLERLWPTELYRGLSLECEFWLPESLVLLGSFTKEISSLLEGFIFLSIRPIFLQ